MRALLIVLGLLVLSACDLARESAFRQAGPGLELFQEDMPATSVALSAYFDELCNQSGFATDASCPPAPSLTGTASPLLEELVSTGYNDIDARCDEYLQWIDNKRAERLLVDETTIALGALLGGILGIAAPETEALA